MCRQGINLVIKAAAERQKLASSTVLGKEQSRRSCSSSIGRLNSFGLKVAEQQSCRFSSTAKIDSGRETAQKTKSEDDFTEKKVDPKAYLRQKISWLRVKSTLTTSFRGCQKVKQTVNLNFFVAKNKDIHRMKKKKKLHILLSDIFYLIF